jgi:hypothetical protein
MISAEILHQLTYEHSRALQAEAHRARQGRQKHQSRPCPDRRAPLRWMCRPAPAGSQAQAVKAMTA